MSKCLPVFGRFPDSCVWKWFAFHQSLCLAESTLFCHRSTQAKIAGCVPEALSRVLNSECYNIPYITIGYELFWIESLKKYTPKSTLNILFNILNSLRKCNLKSNWAMLLTTDTAQGVLGPNTYWNENKTLLFVESWWWKKIQ